MLRGNRAGRDRHCSRYCFVARLPRATAIILVCSKCCTTYLGNPLLSRPISDVCMLRADVCREKIRAGSHFDCYAFTRGPIVWIGNVRLSHVRHESGIRARRHRDDWNRLFRFDAANRSFDALPQNLIEIKRERWEKDLYFLKPAAYIMFRNWTLVLSRNEQS